MEALLSDLSEDDYNSKMAMLPNRQEIILGSALVNFPLKFITACRMQLFLYLKGNGQSILNTMNCWFGLDAQYRNQLIILRILLNVFP